MSLPWAETSLQIQKILQTLRIFCFQRQNMSDKVRGHCPGNQGNFSEFERLSEHISFTIS